MEQTFNVFAVDRPLKGVVDDLSVVLSLDLGRGHLVLHLKRDNFWPLSDFDILAIICSAFSVSFPQSVRLQHFIDKANNKNVLEQISLFANILPISFNKVDDMTIVPNKPLVEHFFGCKIEVPVFWQLQHWDKAPLGLLWSPCQDLCPQCDWPIQSRG